MKTVIIYQSFLGSTRKYAGWLHEKTGAELFSKNQIKGSELKKYDQIVIMSGIYAGKMPLVGYIKNNWEYIKSKKVISVCVGASPADDKVREDALNKLPNDVRSAIIHFNLPGKLFGINKDTVVPEGLEPIVKEIGK